MLSPRTLFLWMVLLTYIQRSLPFGSVRPHMNRKLSEENLYYFWGLSSACAGIVYELCEPKRCRSRADCISLHFQEPSRVESRNLCESRSHFACSPWYHIRSELGRVKCGRQAFRAASILGRLLARRRERGSGRGIEEKFILPGKLQLFSVLWEIFEGAKGRNCAPKM